MEVFDTEKAARVWQRVHAAPGAGPDLASALPALIAGEWEDGTNYLHLSRRFQGKDAQRLRKLFQEEQSHAACLKGIYTLITGDHASLKATPPPREDTETVLRRCYGSEMRCLAVYEQWSAHPEYGPVFARLVQQEREHCRVLLELLGNLKKK